MTATLFGASISVEYRVRPYFESWTFYVFLKIHSIANFAMHSVCAIHSLIFGNYAFIFLRWYFAFFLQGVQFDDDIITYSAGDGPHIRTLCPAAG